MISAVQSDITATELAIVLALIRGRTLAEAGTQVGVNASTVFRVVQRLEKALGQRLFERARDGYRPTELASRLALHAETIETEITRARATFATRETELTGTVRISAVDAVLNSIVVPALRTLHAAHPRLRIDLVGSNELVSLTHRDVDIALRSTNQPPGHLIGKRLGTLRFSVYGASSLGKSLKKRPADSMEALTAAPWVSVDEAMPEHPSTLWRRRAFPKIIPMYQANSMLTAVQLIKEGLCVGVVAQMHAARHRELFQLTPTLDSCQIALWLLTHPESRHLSRISTTARHLESFVLESQALG